MSISSTRKISSNSPTSSRVDRSYFVANNVPHSVENIDTTNNVLVKDENERNGGKQGQQRKQQEQSTNYKTATPDVINSIEAIASSVPPEEQNNINNMHKVDVYSNNQSIIHDQDVEHTGRSYLKHFYEKNEHMQDIDTLV